MSSKSHGASVSPGTILCVLCLLLYSAGFIRIELKSTDHEERLAAVEEVISHIKKLGMVDTSTKENLVIIDSGKKKASDKTKLQRFARSIANKTPLNNSANIKEVLEDVVTSSFKKICQNTGNWNVCPRGMPGLPGRDGSKGDKGDQGKKGRKGSQGVMGQPGRSGKQGIMGPPGIRGEKGVKGDIGAPGIPGMKGEPGEPITAPKVTVSPSQLTVNESTTASLLCSASGNPAPRVAWFRLNGSLPSNKTKVSSEGLMQIDNVRLEDAGKYKCVARNILGREEKVTIIVVQSKPKVSLSFGPSYVEKGKNITLKVCHVTGFPPPKITWLKTYDNIVQDRAVVKDGQLSIINAQKEDTGLYKCQASNHLGHDSAVTHLNVVELPHFTVSPPAQLEMTTMQNITVQCQAAGDPQPTVTWIKENGKLPAGRSKVGVDGSLKIWNPKLEDSGRYTCVASSNEVFKALSSLKLTVKKTCSPVGVADRNKIPDYKITASTIHIALTSNPFYAHYGRLNENRGRGGWCPKTPSDRTDYLQVDMGVVRSVCAVATQAHKYGHWTTSYKLHVSLDGASWDTYKENNAEKVFAGNRDHSNIVKHSLSTAVKARFVRFYPVTYYSFPCLRTEIFV